MLKKIALLFLALSWLGAVSGMAEDKLWAALYLAQNTPPPEQSELASEKLSHDLQDVFGFKHYELIKGEEIALNKPWEQWVIPRRDFFIRIFPVPRKPDEPKVVDYEIYKDGFIVAKGKYEPADGTPLFIKGPDFKQGRFVFILDPR